MSFVLQTYDEFGSFDNARPQDGTIRELVLDEVTNLISRRRPLMANIGQMDVSNTFVELLTDDLEARAHNAAVEGQSFTDPVLSQAVRHFVHVQSFYKSGRVSDEQRLVGHYNGDPMVYQVRKRMDSLMNDIEHTLHRGSAASGATSASRQFDGLLNIFGDTTLTASSGTTLTEEILVDYLQAFRDSDLDVVPTQCYVNSWLKRTISEFSTRITRNVDAAMRMQELIIERHTSDFGDLDVIYSEDQLKSGTKTTSGNSIIFLDPTFFQVGWLRRPMVEQLARDGLSDRFQMNAQCTLVYRHDKAGGGATGLVPYIGQA